MSIEPATNKPKAKPFIPNADDDIVLFPQEGKKNFNAWLNSYDTPVIDLVENGLDTGIETLGDVLGTGVETFSGVLGTGVETLTGVLGTGVETLTGVLGTGVEIVTDAGRGLIGGLKGFAKGFVKGYNSD